MEQERKKKTRGKKEIIRKKKLMERNEWIENVATFEIKDFDRERERVRARYRNNQKMKVV